MQPFLPYLLVALAAAVAGYWAKPSTKPTLLEQFKSLNDDDQLKLMALFGSILGTLFAALLVLVILINKIFDAVAIGLASTVLTLVLSAAWKGFNYFFDASHGGTQQGKALSRIAEGGEEAPAAGAGGKP